ncbi:endosomal transport [Desmophyllum pertusum]|uniref:Endosomal transport n=1 Tax=Desmophyllum pertusum TaxID=174260 RepID=A0A9W9Z6P3_9CNID|nr:endosomal transport [Desmophyllum pertusum]
MVLFVTVLRHAIELLLQESANKLDDSCVNNLLTSRTEPLKPLYLPKQALQQLLPVTIQAKAFSSRSLTLPENVDTRELKRAISFLMDNIGFLNTTGLFHVMFQLMQCVKLAELAPNTFKITVYHLWFLRLICLCFMDLFLEGDELLLLQRMLLVSSQPTLPQGQRLLCFEWLMYFPTDEDTPEFQPSVPHCLDYSQFNFFYPSVFDSLDITLVKLKVLCLCLDHETLNLPGSMGVPLMQCLVPLLKRVQQGIGGKTVVALFRSIFWYYKHHWDSELERELYKAFADLSRKSLIIYKREHFLFSWQASVVNSNRSPSVIPHTVNLLNSVSVITPDSTFPTDLLRSLSERVVSQSVESVLPNLTHHLKLLSLAMRGTDIFPTCSITSSLKCYSDRTWQSVYFLFVQHIGTLTLGTVPDFYYCLLTNVSSKKCSRILASETAKQGLPHIIAEDITTSTFPVPPPVKHVSTPFLKLTRVPQAECEGSLTDMKSSASDELKEFTNTRGLLDQYLKMLDGTTYSKEIPITYYVHFTESPSLSMPAIIYALVLKFHSERRYKKLEDVHISYLSAAKSTTPSEGCCQITVNFCPLDPVPALFQVRAVFCDESGLTCAMKLDNLPVHFSDLFISLQVPARFKTAPLSTIKAELFSVLWDHITKVQHTSGCPTGTGAESIVCLSVEWSTMGRILEERLLSLL